MTRCEICSAKIDEQREVRWTVGGDVVCSLACLVVWRTQNGAC